MTTEYIVQVSKQTEGVITPVFTRIYAAPDDYKAPEQVLPPFALGGETIKGPQPGKPTFSTVDRFEDGKRVGKWAIITVIAEGPLQLMGGDHFYVMAEIPNEQPKGDEA